jgi:hypothetical protein
MSNKLIQLSLLIEYLTDWIKKNPKFQSDAMDIQMQCLKNWCGYASEQQQATAEAYTDSMVLREIWVLVSRAHANKTDPLAIIDAKITSLKIKSKDFADILNGLSTRLLKNSDPDQ